MLSIKANISKLLTRYRASDTRSKEVVHNVMLATLMKAVSVVASLLIVPMTISYINPARYGIWLTLSSIIGWVNFFDLGLGNGFRNRFAEAKAHGDTLLARRLVSTTYFAISSIVVVVLMAALAANAFIDWSKVLKVSAAYRGELSIVFAVVITFTCINMVANVFSSLLSADQKNGWGSCIFAAGQYVSLLVVYILTKTTTGDLVKLAVFYSGVPSIVMLVVSFVMFRCSRYKMYRPSFKYIKLNLIGNIMKLGVQFFVIYLCLIFVFQIVNVVISRQVGPMGVTQYNIANKYFNVIYMAVIIIITPMWSAFTDAYAKKDMAWMKSMVHNMGLIWLLMSCGGLVMLLVSPLFYHIWIGDKVDVPVAVSIAMFVYVVCQSLGNMFMTMINGIGTVRIQLIVYVAFALVSWPLFTCLGRFFGLVGIIAVPSLVYLIQGLLSYIQLRKIISGEASGIWLK